MTSDADSTQVVVVVTMPVRHQSVELGSTHRKSSQPLRDHPSKQLIVTYNQPATRTIDRDVTDLRMSTFEGLRNRPNSKRTGLSNDRGHGISDNTMIRRNKTIRVP